MESSFPLVSFIIPCYKVEPFLSDCLDSILQQQERSWEAIVIDDGSPDNSGKIADEYALKDSRFIIIHQVNQGVSVARNKGLEIASGKWIWFVDSDDYLVDNALSILAPIIEANDCDTVFFGLRHHYLDSEKDQQVKCLFGISKNELLEQVFCYTNPSMLFSNAVIRQNQIRFTTGISMAEDLEFQYKYLLLCKSPVSISDCLYVYRHREESATSNSDTFLNNMNDCLRVAHNLLGFLNDVSGAEQMWLSFRVRSLLKSGLQSAEHLSVDERGHLQEVLREIVYGFTEKGYRGVKDMTLCLACWNLNLYFHALRVYYRMRSLRL